jgi:hypothetical protein
MDRKRWSEGAIRGGEMRTFPKAVVWALWIGLLLMTVNAVQAAYVITSTGRRIEGVELRADEKGGVMLRTADGQEFTFQKGRYREASVAKPEALTRAERSLAEGDAVTAEALFISVKEEFAFLQWDIEAAQRLAELYTREKRHAEAAKEFAVLAKDDPVFRRPYLEALWRAEAFEELRPVLVRDIAAGSHEEAAFAYLLTGRLLEAEGKLEEARQAYRKIELFFSRETCCVEEARERLAAL